MFDWGRSQTLNGTIVCPVAAPVVVQADVGLGGRSQTLNGTIVCPVAPLVLLQCWSGGTEPDSLA